MTTEIVRNGSAALANEYNPEQVALIKRTIAPDLTDNELSLFVEVCRRSRLDPFRRQIYAIKRNTKQGPRVTHQTSIDGFRVIASRTGEYEGQIGPLWCGEDGVWKDVWIAKTAPVASKVGVHRKGFREPVWGVARFLSYAGDNLWVKMAEVMIAKCAEALALRKAFPEDLSGLYTGDEMAQADSSPRATVVTMDGEIVEPEAVDAQDFASLIDGAKSLADLTAIAHQIKASGIGPDVRKPLLASWTARKQALATNGEAA